MSTSSRTAQTGLTFTDVIARIQADQDLSARKRHDACSALRTFAKAMGKDLSEAQADAAWVRELQKGFAPAMAGLTPERWSNVLSLLNFALDHVAITWRRHRNEPLSAPWAAAMASLPKKPMSLRVGIASFAHYGSAHGIAPDQVTEETFAAFLEHLNRTAVRKDPWQTYRTTLRVWNKAADTVPSWPKLKVTIPDRRNSYLAAWTMFPPSLKAEYDAYLDHLAGKDIFAERDFKPLRPSSRATKAAHLHEFISALVRCGHDPAKFTSLKVILEFDMVKDGLRFFHETRKAERQAHAVAVTLVVLGKHWAKVSPEALEKLQKLASALDNAPRGMTKKNKERLRQFDNPENVKRLLDVPRKLRKKAAKTKSVCKQALLMQSAVAIEILINAPIRLDNLSHLAIGQNVIRMKKGAVRIVLTEHETKNGMPYDAILLPEPSALIETYIDKYRAPLIARCKPGGAWLFPGYNGPKCNAPFRKQIMGSLYREAGLLMNPHLFRHFAAKVILDAMPGNYGLARLTLAHKSVATTVRVYAGTENGAAVRRYDEHILKMRGPETPSTPKRKRRA